MEAGIGDQRLFTPSKTSFERESSGYRNGRQGFGDDLFRTEGAQVHSGRRQSSTSAPGMQPALPGIGGKEERHSETSKASFGRRQSAVPHSFGGLAKSCKEIEDSESSLDSGSEDDAVLELLMKAQKVQKKSKPERATGSEKGHAKKGARDRYPLLAGRSRSREDSPEDLTTVLKQLGRTKTGGLGADSLTALVNLELLKTLQKKKKKSRRSKSPDSSDSSGADSFQRVRARTVRATASSRVREKPCEI